MSHTTKLSRTAISAATLALVAFMAACGKSGSTATDGGSGTIHIWALQDAQNQPVIQSGIEAYQKSGKVKLQLSSYINDAYKQKLQVSMGSPNGPDIFFNWGGGNLAQFVQAGQVADLTEKAGPVLDTFLPSVLATARIDGKQYGLPMNGIQPVLLFYNKDVFAKASLEPPTTYDQLLSLIDAFKAKGITPIALAGSQGWTELMYLEYLLDRVGGPDKFAAIAAGKAGAWRDPAVLKAAEMCQDLAKRGAFGTNFASINYDNTGSSAMFTTGKAAMQVMGSWEYSNQQSNFADFFKSGNLGWAAFPSVADGQGDPKNVVGNPSNYFSVRASSSRATEAIDFLVKTLNSEGYVSGLIAVGQVPAIKGVDAKLAGTPNAAFATFTYNLVAQAPAFTQSWDQALSPAVGDALLTNLQKLFLSSITPEDFVAAMEQAR